MGYVAAFKKSDIAPPVALVLTETVVDIHLFPFIKTAHHLLTAAQLSVNLWQAVPRVKPKCLLLLVCLAYADFKVYNIEHSMAEDHEELRNIVVISTESDSKDELIERLTAANAAEKAAYEAEKAAYTAMYEARIKALEHEVWTHTQNTLKTGH